MVVRKSRLNRDLLIVAIPTTLIVMGAIALTLLLMRPAPPSEIVMSTGTGEGSYQTYALKYRDILARDGVTLRLWSSSGAVENLRRLSDPSAHVDVALVQGGIVSGRHPKARTDWCRWEAFTTKSSGCFTEGTGFWTDCLLSRAR